MTPYGPIRFSFGDPKLPRWAMVVLGVALTLAGALVALIFVLQGVGGIAMADLIGVVVLVALTGGLGPPLFLWGVYDLVRPAEWHVTDTHVYRTRGSSVGRTFVLAQVGAPILTQIFRYGQLIGVRVNLGEPGFWDLRPPALVVPNMDVANGIVRAWQAQRR